MGLGALGALGPLGALKALKALRALRVLRALATARRGFAAIGAEETLFVGTRSPLPQSPLWADTQAA